MPRPNPRSRNAWCSFCAPNNGLSNASFLGSARCRMPRDEGPARWRGGLRWSCWLFGGSRWCRLLGDELLDLEGFFFGLGLGLFGAEGAEDRHDEAEGRDRGDQDQGRVEGVGDLA